METIFKKLTNKGAAPSTEIESFPCPLHLSLVTLESKEVTALCPITNQPDLYTVRIEYVPQNSCIETKSLKLYLWTFRDRGIFAESLASEIARHIFDVALPLSCVVTAEQQIRGGIKTFARAEVKA